MTTGGKPQGVRVVTDDELIANGGTFRVQPGPAMRVSALDAATRGVTGGASVAVYVVDAAYVAAHGAIGGNPLLVADLTAVARGVEHPLIAIPVLVVDGSLGATPVVPLPDIYTYLKFWLPLDEATGQLREDAHGAYDFTDGSGATPGVPEGTVFGAAGSRVTGTHHLYNADNSLATNGQDFCVAGWMRTVGTTQFPKISRNANPLSPALNRDWEIAFSDGNFAGSAIYVRELSLAINGATQFFIVPDTWFFFAGWMRTVSPTQVELGIRVNGITFTSVVATPTVATANPAVMIGRRDYAPTPAYSNGNYDEIAYWIGYVPTEAELDDIQNAGDGMTYGEFVEHFTDLLAPELTLFEMETTSTSAAWQSQNVVKGGSTMTWAVYDADHHYLTSAENNQPTFDLSVYPGTKTVRITSPDGWAALSEITLSSLGLLSINVRVATALTNLGCGGNSLTILDITANTLLQYLFCWGNDLPTVDTSQNTALVEIDMNSNPLTSVDFSANVLVENLKVHNAVSAGGGLTSIDLTANTELATLYVYGNLLTTLDVSTLANLFTFYCYNNLLTDLVMPPTAAPKNLRCQSNKLSSSEIDTIIINMDAGGQVSGTLNYSTQSPAANPTNAALAAYNSLIGKGFTITGTAPPP